MRAFAFAPLLLLSAAAPADERTYLIGSFERLRVDGPLAVEVAPGSPSAVASGDRRALDRLVVRVEGGTLVIGQGVGMIGEGAAPGTVRVRVGVPAMRSVLVNGGGDVRVAELTGSRVELALNGDGRLSVGRVRGDEASVTLTGSGAVTLGGTAARLRMRLYGTGSVDASALVAQDAVLISESSGSVRADVRGSARVVATGSGTVEVLGGAECAVSGSGPVRCGAGG